MLTPDDLAIDYLVDKGFDAKMGARLQRVIDKEIKTDSSKWCYLVLQKGGKTAHKRN